MTSSELGIVWDKPLGSRTTVDYMHKLGLPYQIPFNPGGGIQIRLGHAASAARVQAADWAAEGFATLLAEPAWRDGRRSNA